MKIQVEVEIYDDEDYCHSPEKECKYLDRYMRKCCLFNIAVHFRDNLSYYEKCPQCKEAYHKAAIEQTTMRR
jgi:hypothetical protein